MENNQEQQDAVQNESSSVEVQQNTADATVQTNSGDSVVNAANNETVVDTKKEKKKGGKKGILFCLFLAIVLIAGGIYIFAFHSKPAKSTKIEKDSKEVNSLYRMSGNSLEDFDLYFLQLENEAKNKVYSPLSIKYALAMLREGTKGESKTQIDNIIGDYVAKKYPNNEHMSFANAMFIKNTFQSSIKDTYTKSLVDKYNAEVITDPFESPDNINNWVSNKTFNLVNNLLDDVSGNQFFLINALAIDMNWNNQIHCECSHKIPCIGDGTYKISYAHEILDDDATENYNVTEYPYASEDEFYSGYNRKNEFNGREGTKGGNILADFNKYDIIKDLGEDNIKEIIKPEYEKWLQTEYGKNGKPYDEFIGGFIQELKDNYGKGANSTDFLVYEDENVKEFAKDLQTYDGTTLQYIGIMPKNVELTEFIKSSDKNSLTKIIKELKEVKIDSFEEGYATRIRGFIPFFKFEYDLKLREDLEKLGVKNIFDEKKADLSNITSEKGLYIDKAIHKANIEFSNDGIKAAAATALGGYGATHGPYFEHLFKVPVKEIDMNFNKPYMYIIRDKESGEVWFTGTVYEPIAK